MLENTLKIATCQFAVSGSIAHNSQSIQKLMRQAADGGANVVHFCECALSGYAGIDFDSFDGFDWDMLKSETEKIIALAAELKVWVVLGSTHRLSEPNKPHNSLYLIGPDGTIRDRYDKRFCMDREMPFYTPGDHFVMFEVNGIKCALLICFDLRFPELYRQLKKLGAACLLQSFYNARQKGPSIHSDIMIPSMQCRAATNFFWVSMSNSSGWLSPYPGCFIRPDGRVVEKLANHKDGVIVNTVNLAEDLYDPSAAYRDMAIDGALDNALDNLDDERSRNRNSY
jgi:predicted amidohydrolase